jgi:Peptidase A4 family
MVRRWCIPLATMALVIGSWLAAASSSAAPRAVHPALSHPAAAQGLTPGGRMIRPAAGQRPSAGHGVSNAEVQSTNWSGYAATGANGAFRSVSASWTEPTATCSSNRRRTDQYAAFWVGLDGYSSDSVEQTGTDSDCVGTTPDYYGWYEMYPAAPVYFTNTVHAGDHISASVTFSGTETYPLVLKDTTQGWTQTITKNQVGLARSSAEVITEAPSSNTGVLPLADFGTVSYTGATANGTSLGSQSPTEIVMVDGSGNAEDSTSAITSAGAFSNTWLRST